VAHGPPTVLVVEDHADTRTALCEFLQDEGLEVTVAGNGAEGVRVFSKPFDIEALVAFVKERCPVNGRKRP
jgi:DNA-binding response OmpR family regulator